MLRQLIISLVLSCFTQQAQAKAVAHPKRVGKKAPRKTKRMIIYGIGG